MKKAATIILLMLVCARLEAVSVTGRVRSTGRAAGSTVIVYAEPLDNRRVQPGKFKMTQKNKSFFPHTLVVPVGSTVSFPNDDMIFHNVFSLSRPNPFDLGLYRDGQTKDRIFTTPGIYRVFCNIHPQMSATILVVPTTYTTEADNTGSYRFDLPPGRYRVTAWNERSSQPSSVEIAVDAGGQTISDITLDESQSVDTNHKNKFGQDYPKSAYDPKKN
jgi:plastocyanin